MSDKLMKGVLADARSGMSDEDMAILKGVQKFIEHDCFKTSIIRRKWSHFGGDDNSYKVLKCEVDGFMRRFFSDLIICIHEGRIYCCVDDTSSRSPGYEVKYDALLADPDCFKHVAIEPIYKYYNAIVRGLQKAVEELKLIPIKEIEE